MTSRRRVRLTTGSRPNLYQANFGGTIADPYNEKGKGSRSRKGGRQSLKENRRIYRNIRRILASVGFSTHFNPDTDHDCYEKKIAEGTVFFVHLPNGRVTEHKPAHKWILTIYAADRDNMHTHHSQIKERITFVPDFINSGDPQGFIRRLEHRLMNRLARST